MEEGVVTVVEEEGVVHKNPIVIEGLPDVGLVGTIAASYVIEKMGYTKIGYVESDLFPPFCSPPICPNISLQTFSEMFRWWAVAGKNRIFAHSVNNNTFSNGSVFYFIHSFCKFFEIFCSKHIFPIIINLFTCMPYRIELYSIG